MAGGWWIGFVSGHAMKKTVFLLAFLVAIGRVFIAPRLVHIPSFEGTYEAFAHLFVGFLIIVPFYDRKQTLGPSHLYGYIGWALGLWELAWFVGQRFL
jgi:hypothetical protein